jgi:hypothetical protein
LNSTQPHPIQLHYTSPLTQYKNPNNHSGILFSAPSLIPADINPQVDLENTALIPDSSLDLFPTSIQVQYYFLFHPYLHMNVQSLPPGAVLKHL